jgi:hypothetical protein
VGGTTVVIVGVPELGRRGEGGGGETAVIIEPGLGLAREGRIRPESESVLLGVCCGDTKLLSFFFLRSTTSS